MLRYRMIAWASCLLWPAICVKINYVGQKEGIYAANICRGKLADTYHDHLTVLEVQLLDVVDAALHRVLVDCGCTAVS